MFSQRYYRAILTVAVFTACAFPTLDAKIIYVNGQSTDPASPYGSWESAAQNLDEALVVAEDGDEVWVASGTYKPAGNSRDAAFKVGVDLSIFGGFAGGESDITQKDPLQNMTILSGDIAGDDDQSKYNDNLYSVMEVDDKVNGVGKSVLVDGLFFRGSRILNRESLEINRCSFTGYSDFFGGALFSDGGNVLATESQFLNCLGTFGGAVRNNPSADFTAINCLFSGNSTPMGSGGAIDNEDASGTYINCEFSGNQGGSGGAVRNVRSSPVFINCTFSGNLANDGGGAMSNIENASPSFTNCILWNNRAVSSTKTISATIYSVITSNPTFSHCLVANSGGSDDWDAGIGTDLGNNIDVDPLFIDAFNPSAAPSTTGDLRVTTGSPILDVGDYGTYDGIEGPDKDLLGNLRLLDDPTVTDAGIGAFTYLDLGCYEGAADYTVPVIESWVIPTALPVSTNFLEFQITFSEIVQNLTAADFELLIDGNLDYFGLSIESEENGKSYTVTMNGISGAGIVRGSLNAEHNVADPSGNRVEELIPSEAFYVDPEYTVHFVNAQSSNPEVPYDTWEKAATSIQEVIPFGADGDQLWVAAGTYTPGTEREATFLIRNEISLYGGFAGDESMLSDRMGSGFESVLSGDLLSDDNDGGDNSENAYQVVKVDDGNPSTKQSVVLNGFTIQGGNADSEQAELQSGGGIYSVENLSVENCILQGNYAEMGGAIFSSLGNLTVQNSSIVRNSAVFGGGLLNESSSQLVVNTRFSGNLADDGGAVRNSSGSSTFVNCLLSGNAAGFGGGISNEDSDTSIVNCTLSGNWAYDDGGAVFGSSNSTTFIENAILWNNRAAAFTSRPASSVSSISSTARVSRSLIANSGGSDAWNVAIGIDEGGNIDSDPFFVAQLDPLGAPSTMGDFRLLPFSPALDNADYNDYLSAGGPADDLAGADRFFDDPDTDNTGVGLTPFLDLGAFEFQLDGFGMYARWIYTYFPTTTSFDQLMPEADLDNDKINNLVEFAYLLNPTEFDASDLLEGSIDGLSYRSLTGFIIPETDLRSAQFVFGRANAYSQMGLNISVIISNDLSNWSELALMPQSLASDGTFELLALDLSSIEVDPETPAFIKLLVELESD